MKRIASLLILVSCALLLASCGAGHIEDTNGDDISLCSLTDEDIFGKTTSYVAVGAVSTQVNNKHTFKASRLSGIYEYIRFTKDRGAFTINADTSVEEGNLRVVVLCDGKYVADIAVKKGESLRIENKLGGKYEIRFAAESARFSFECTVE